jgi:hypothetical protein
MSKPTYTVTVTQEGRYWVGKVEGVRGAAVETRRLDRLHDEVRHGLALLLDVDPASLDLSYDYAFKGELREGLKRFEEHRRERERVEREFVSLESQLVKQLLQAHVSDRDAGTLLGISHAMVQKVRKREVPNGRLVSH